MALGGEMQDPVGAKGRQRLADGACVTDIAALKLVARIRRNGRQRGQIAGVGELVEDENAMRRFANEPTNHRGADEARAAGDENAP